MMYRTLIPDFHVKILNLTPKVSHLTGDQTELQSPPRISNLDSGELETDLAPRSKTCSGIWVTSPRTPHNSTSGLDTRTFTPRTRMMLSQLDSTDSTLRNLLRVDSTTTVSNFDFLTYLRTVNNENSQH